MQDNSVRIVASADTALVVEFGDAVDIAVSERVLLADAAIRDAGLSGVVESVPTFRSLIVHYDPLATTSDELSKKIAPLVENPGAYRRRARHWRIPVCYEAEFAPDLDFVSRESGLTPRQVIERHCSKAYHIYMIGFLPGYPYAGDLPEEICLPRRENPRTRLPAGSVGIATTMTAVYPYERPGGWHLIGTTPVPVFDPQKSPPAVLAAGDTIRFEPISGADYGRIRDDVRRGEFSLQGADSGP